jgi:RNA polymerase sigma factor (TIGR02999 family)
MVVCIENGDGAAMSDRTPILSAIEQGDPHAPDQLLPLVYDELRKLAASRLADENPGQTLQATALVHEAYIRLVDAEKTQHWNSRGHLFSAAAEAMRRILVENARHKHSQRAGGDRIGVSLSDFEPATPAVRSVSPISRTRSRSRSRGSRRSRRAVR